MRRYATSLLLWYLVRNCFRSIWIDVCFLCLINLIAMYVTLRFETHSILNLRNTSSRKSLLLSYPSHRCLSVHYVNLYSCVCNQRPGSVSSSLIPHFVSLVPQSSSLLFYVTRNRNVGHQSASLQRSELHVHETDSNSRKSSLRSSLIAVINYFRSGKCAR